MGCCESKRNALEQTGVTQGNINNNQLEKVTRNDPLKISQTIIEEDFIEDFWNSYKELPTIISNRLSNLICRILVETQGKEIIGTGFILTFKIDLDIFYCLITNGHIISNEFINSNNTINLIFGENKAANIELDRNKRYIKSFIDEGLDITVVEILDEDNISKKYYLEPELDSLINKNLINKEIYIPQYIEGLKLKNAEGIIKDIINYEFSHLANTKHGSSGSPIFLKNRKRVIGIHKAGIENRENFGDFIYPVIKKIKKNIRKKSINGKYIDKKYI